MPNHLRLKFPKNFLWGAATSAHQVEGGLHNQWTIWELKNATSLAARAPYLYDDLESWGAIKVAAKRPHSYVSGRAADHYRLFEQDIELVHQLNMNAFRFSVEWSRVQPDMDTWNKDAIDHYRRVLAACKKRGIEPIVTLFHFTLPEWFSELGGFEHGSNVHYFVDYAERVLRELGPSVRYVITINEPEVYAAESYLHAAWPPQQQSRRQWLCVLHNLIKAHNQLAKRIHGMSRRYRVSITKNSSYIYPGDDSWLSVRAAAVMQYWRDDFLLRRVIKQCDFIGLNYYFSDRVYGYRVHNPSDRVNDVGWNMQPDNLTRALERLYEAYQIPILITENGLADAADTDRQWWLGQTVLAMQRALDKGIVLIGYLHWSLLDNFEWDKGFWPRFGLFAVDYATMQRTPRKSAIWFSRLIKKARNGG